jgi:hypothetical protein
MENGQLPTHDVGWAELPAKFIDAIALVSSERACIRKEGTEDPE